MANGRSRNSTVKGNSSSKMGRTIKGSSSQGRLQLRGDISSTTDAIIKVRSRMERRREKEIT